MAALVALSGDPASAKTLSDCRQEYAAKQAANETGGQSQETLGSNVWGGGPTAVLVYMDGPWVAGALANNIWSFGGAHGPLGNSYNTFLTQPFVNYNFGEGWYVSTAPLITANWQVNGTKWTAPIGAQAGRVFRLGKLPINLSIGAYYNVVKPTYAGDWQLRSQVTLIL